MKAKKKRLLEHIVNQRAKLIEGYAWERKPGGALPTLEDTMARHQNAPINEAEMDRRFQRDWEKSCRALINHIKHEQQKDNRSNTRELGKLMNWVQEAQGVPAKLSKIVGTN
jgi:hypothetical protein